MKEYMIDTIYRYLYYEDGTLENMTEEEVRQVYENLIDWIG